MNLKSALVVVLIVLVSTKVMAADSISPGVYYNESGSDTLEVTRSGPVAPLMFTLQTRNAYGHGCTAGGEIKNDRAVTEEKCVIEFEKLPDRISVSAPDESGEACRSLCGSGTTELSGEFFLEIPFCVRVDSIRAEFSQHYKSAQYQKARGVLVELLSKCEPLMDWRTEASVRNDLAITEFRLKDKLACLKALEPLKSDFIDDHDTSEMSFNFLVREDDVVKVDAMIKTTRFNWKKCGGKLPNYSDAN